MARSDYDDSPRISTQRRRKNSRTAVPPAVPDVPDSPNRPRRHRHERDDSRHRGSDWDPRYDDETLLRTPESRASSSSYRHSHGRRYYDSEHPRDQSTTPSHSLASSRTSVPTPHPPRSSVTRQSSVAYRRPSVSLREPSLSADYEDLTIPERRSTRSRSRSIPLAPSAPISRRTSRTRQSTSPSSSSDSDHDASGDDDDDDDAEVAYDSYGTMPKAPGYRETRLVRVDRSQRAPSRAGTERRGKRRQITPAEPLSPDEESESDELEIPARSPFDEVPLAHMASRAPSRAPSRPQSRSKSRSYSRPASVRHVQEHENDMVNDADSDEPTTSNLRDRFERRGDRKQRHSAHPSGDRRRNRSESHSRRSTPSTRYVSSAASPKAATGSSSRVRSSKKAYHESESAALEMRDRYHPPSAAARRPKSHSASLPLAAASQHVSLSTKRSSFLGNFFGSSFSGHAHHHASANPIKLVSCVVCMDDFPSRKATKLKCGHRMCNSCLKRSFKLSITDPQHMPPKCCTADYIPLKHVERLFDKDFKKNWNKKFVEFSARNRIYCPRRGCGEFIGPEDIRYTNDGKKYGKCSRCATKTCVHCSGKWHRGRECPKDEETARVLVQAQEAGWQRCRKCKAMIELLEGCNHMTCMCGAEFCYICGAKWKSCDCPWFNYDTVENDRLQHMQVPIPMPMRDRYGPHSSVDFPPSSPQHDGRSRLRSRPQTYEEEVLYHREAGERDAARARRPLNYQNYGDEEDDEDYLGGFGDITSLGNAAGHFLNEDFRPKPRMVVPQPHAPPPPPLTSPLDPAPIFERAPAGDYIHDVSRARRPRANSLTRLAERFNKDGRSGGPAPRPPPPMPTAATMPLPGMMPSVMQGPPGRRGLMDAPSLGRVLRPSAPVYEEPEEVGVLPTKSKSGSRKQQQQQQHNHESAGEAPRSAMAGLTGDGRYRNRVDEWRIHVPHGPGEFGAEMVS